MKIVEVNIEAIRRREAACEGEDWLLDRAESGAVQWLVRSSESVVVEGSVMHDLVPAPADDLAFVACSRRDVRYLLAAIERDGDVSAEILNQIARRSSKATPPPWRPIEEESGLGDSIIIAPTRGGEDIYLNVGDRAASSGSFVFVAHARQDIQILLGLAYRALLRKQLPEEWHSPFVDSLKD